MNKHDWTVQDAIEERVRQEDLAEWAAREVQPFQVITVSYPKLKRPPLVRFISLVTP